ncbi:MAG: 6,7-dimethyl-8-ribityllumazine synthase [Flavobacteriaceae bacterium]|jgi:6,7-dimethyl-8-ribityllumazine synthase|nr:6,7-dimethyl-8-ribityllumazine synthase [Flavobacteriaceae bacterium]MBN11320.1 6,7-dimethyl-8-ribityllumazine synthase [Flavobacteriaceae bacterium]MBR63037.1 6,7-dimethyl-8-ribityllumazine synthase [Flavobacteriaceae bacterium]|tara:strand:+ start:1644 stop:2111 length:468 start_codon:yes stop_codon:yes gene_type:complete
MATNSQNSKHIVHEKLPVAQDLRFALIVSQWNSEITNRLYEGAHQILQQQQAKQIDRIDVPGSFELVYASRVAIKKNYDAIIAIGNVIRGETSHFDYVCQGVTNGIQQLNAMGTVPVIFCVLTDDTIEQSRARSGGSLGNKGEEAAVAAILMASL